LTGSVIGLAIASRVPSVRVVAIPATILRRRSLAVVVAPVIITFVVGASRSIGWLSSIRRRRICIIPRLGWLVCVVARGHVRIVAGAPSGIRTIATLLLRM